jgi:hypothetical protein
MAIPSATNASPIGKIQAPSVDLEISAERDRLQAELAKAQSEREAYAKAWIKSQCTDDILQLTNEEILSDVGRKPPLRDLIAQLESGT